MNFTRPDKPGAYPGAKGHRYGWINPSEAIAFEKLLLRIKDEFGAIEFLEIGVFGGSTLSGVYECADRIGCPLRAAGVDLPQGRPEAAAYPNYTFYEGDSMNMWRTMTGMFNLLFIDGCHCVTHAAMDFLNYSPFVVVGGYTVFHDTAGLGPPADKNYWPQDHSVYGQPPSTLGVRDGLIKLGLLQGHRADWKLEWEIREGDLQGMCCFKKMKEL